MGTFSPGMKINGAISNAVSGTGNQTLYTCPANCYAEVQIYGTTPATGSLSINVGGRQVGSIAASTSITLINVRVGPGQTVVAAMSVSVGGQTATISGVEYINT